MAAFLGMIGYFLLGLLVWFIASNAVFLIELAVGRLPSGLIFLFSMLPIAYYAQKGRYREPEFSSFLVMCAWGLFPPTWVPLLYYAGKGARGRHPESPPADNPREQVPAHVEPVVKVCRSCGTLNEESALACIKCGSSFVLEIVESGDPTSNAL